MNSSFSETLRELNVDDEKVLREYLTEMMSKVKLDDIESWHKIVDTLIETDVSYAHVIDHPIFIRIKNTFVNILQEPLNDFLLFRRIGQLFSRMADHIDNKNIDLFQQIFIDATVIECLSKELNRASLKSPENLINGIQHMVDAYQKFQRDRPHIQDNPILSTLIIPIVNLVKSSEYQTLFLALSSKQEELTHFQHLILITSPKYIVTFWCKRQEEITYAIAEEILCRSSNILQHFLPDIDDWKESVIQCIFYLIWLCQYCSNDRLLLDYKVEHAKILDCVLKLVQGKELLHMASQDSTFGNLQKRASQLVCYATLYIYATTFLTELCRKLKKSNITPILLRLTKVNYDKTQFHAYRILAVVLSDNDIKQLADPAQITAIFITYLKKTMNVASRGRRLTNLLLNLKNLIQHDQIKAEFVRQSEGLSLLIQCAKGTEFDVAKVQLPALEIIMSLTFNDEGNSCIKQNDNFIQYIKTLVSTSSRPILKKIAGGILWRLFRKDEKAKTEYLYDIMISYSHKEKDICHRICNALIADKFRVWIDHERLHGVMMEAMAQAIEQSRYVLICMSDNYYLSPYCQAEAQYAFEKRRQLIPLRVQSGYKAEGWLAFIISGRLYVDFMKMDYDIAYAQLVSQLHQTQVDRKSSLTISTHSNIIEAPLVRNVRTASSYPSDILQWTPVDVRDFLLDKQLNPLVPICQFMDGETFIELYKMCRINSPVMLQTLRSEAMEHSVQLSTNVYLTFLREIKKLISEEKHNRTIFGFQNCTLI